MSISADHSCLFAVLLLFHKRNQICVCLLVNIPLSVGELVVSFGKLFLLDHGTLLCLFVDVIVAVSPLFQNMFVVGAAGHDLLLDPFGVLHLRYCQRVLVYFGGVVIEVVVTLHVELLFVDSELIPHNVLVHDEVLIHLLGVLLQIHLLQQSAALFVLIGIVADVIVSEHLDFLAGREHGWINLVSQSHFVHSRLV